MTGKAGVEVEALKSYILTPYKDNRPHPKLGTVKGGGGNKTSNRIMLFVIKEVNFQNHQPRKVPSGDPGRGEGRGAASDTLPLRGQGPSPPSNPESQALWCFSTLSPTGNKTDQPS